MLSVFFILYILIYILLPGLVLGEMLGVNVAKKSTQLLCAFFCGLGVLILEYLFLEMIEITKAIAFINPVFDVAVLVFYKKKKEYFLDFFKQFKKINVIAFIGIFVFIYGLTYMTMISTLKSNNGVIYGVFPDVAYAISMIAELTHMFPMRDFILAGDMLPYHCFHPLIFAIFKIITGFSAYEIFYYSFALYNGFISALAIVSLIDFKKNNHWVVNLFLPTLVFLGGFGTFIFKDGLQTLQTFSLAPIGEGTAFAAFIACFLLFDYCVNKEGYKQFIFLFLSVFAASGTKSTVLLVFLGAVIGTFIVKTICEWKINKQVLIGTAVVCVAYLIVFLGVVGGTGQVSSPGKLGLQIDFRTTYGSSMVCDIFKRLGAYGRIHYVGYVLLYFVVGGPLSIISVYLFIKKIKVIFKERQTGDVLSLVSLASVFVGTILYMFTYQLCSSHKQFLIPVMISLVWIVSYVVNNYSVSKRSWFKIVMVYALVTGIFTEYNEIQRYIVQFNNRANTQISEESYDSISSGEIEGCKWLSENTPEESVILIDRMNTDEKTSPIVVSARYYYYNAFAERQTFLSGPFYCERSEEEIIERYNTNMKIYESSDKELDNLLSENNIDYIVVTKWLGTDFNPGNAAVSKVFDNGSMAIYQNTN